ncbi:Dirigent protein 10 [Linum grandiflorum]
MSPKNNNNNRVLNNNNLPFLTGAQTNPVAATVMTFFMHDILGGSNPTTRAVTGIVNNPAINGQVPFSKPNGAFLPVNTDVSQKQQQQ